MKTFVTGASGFLGSHLVDRLCERGDEVHVLLRKTSNPRWLLERNIHYHYGDVLEDLKEGLEGADLVFHVAGLLKARNPQTYYEVNTRGTAHLLEACLKSCPSVKRIVLVTSLAAHGPNSGDQAAREEDECHPLTEYGKSKRDAEIVAERYQDRLPITIVRPPAIYGPRDEQILSFFRLVKRGFVFLPGRGPHFLNLAYVKDVVKGLLLVSESPQAVGETFFIGDERNYEWREVGDTVAKAVGCRSTVKIPVPKALLYGVAGFAEIISWFTGRVLPLNIDYSRNFLQSHWTLDIGKAKRILGFRPDFSFSRGVEETVQWYEEEGWI